MTDSLRGQINTIENIISELNLDSIESKVLGSVDDLDKVFSILFQYKSKVLSG